MKKVLIGCLCAVMVAVAVIGGTLAYFTDTSEKAVNTFTMGDVQIELDEAKVDEYGVPANSKERVTENNYLMIPGHTYTKDPTTTVLANSEDCYVRMKVTVEKLAELKAVIPEASHPEYYKNGVLLLQKVVGGWDKSEWNTEWDYGFNATTNTYEFRYKEVVKKSASDTVLPALFTEFTIPTFLDNEDVASINALQFDVVAEAIQADGFDTAAKAWAAFDAQEAK